MSAIPFLIVYIMYCCSPKSTIPNLGYNFEIVFTSKIKEQIYFLFNITQYSVHRYVPILD